MSKIDSVIEKYESGAFISREDLIKMQRVLACEMYHLTTLNIAAYQKWNGIVFRFQGSNAAAKVEADEAVPELRRSRKILDACRSVAIAINSELNYIKND